MSALAYNVTFEERDRIMERRKQRGGDDIAKKSPGSMNRFMVACYSFLREASNRVTRFVIPVSIAPIMT